VLFRRLEFIRCSVQRRGVFRTHGRRIHRVCAGVRAGFDAVAQLRAPLERRAGAPLFVPGAARPGHGIRMRSGNARRCGHRLFGGRGCLLGRRRARSRWCIRHGRRCDVRGVVGWWLVVRERRFPTSGRVARLTSIWELRVMLDSSVGAITVFHVAADAFLRSAFELARFALVATKAIGLRVHAFQRPRVHQVIRMPGATRVAGGAGGRANTGVWRVRRCLVVGKVTRGALCRGRRDGGARARSTTESQCHRERREGDRPAAQARARGLVSTAHQNCSSRNDMPKRRHKGFSLAASPGGPQK